MKTDKFIFFLKNGVGILFVLLVLFFAGCQDETKLGLSAQDDIPPSPPTVDSIVNMNGAAIIYFSAPADDDLLCITATYEINNVEYTTKSSVYNNSLKVEGFGTTGNYKVILKSVDKSQNESTPVEVNISPLEAPVNLIYESLDVVASFGGIKLTWENADENNIIVGVFTKDDAGDWISLENFYSSARDGLATIRGMDTINYTFGITVRDRWDNYSPMLVTEKLPLYEEQLNKSLFRKITALPNDAITHNTTTLDVPRIWDDITTSSDCYHTNTTTGIGNFVTFDMGQKAKLSRFKMWQRQHNSSFFYTHNNLKHYIVYGCVEITEEMRNTGSLDGWTFVKEAYCHKPSGADNPVVTDEDVAYMRSGDEHEISLDVPEVRYIRILFLETWSGGTICQIAEMTFWGQVSEVYY